MRLCVSTVRKQLGSSLSANMYGRFEESKSTSVKNEAVAVHEATHGRKKCLYRDRKDQRYRLQRTLFICDLNIPPAHTHSD